MKKVFLTGGSGDIGGAIKADFEVLGYSVHAPLRSELDLCDKRSIDRFLADNTLDYDILIHCAGFNSPEEIASLPLKSIEETIQINTLSFYSIVQKSIPHLKVNGGKILGISSLYGSVGRYGRSAYTMSKHALNGLIKTIALELGQYNVIANTLSPGYVDTVMTRKNNDTAKISGFEERIPLGRLATPEDISRVAVFLCSEKNSYISGQDIVVDGGYIAGGFQN